MRKVKLGDVCDFINGGAWSDKEYSSFGLPVLKVSNCKNSGFELDEIDYLPYELEEKYHSNRLKKGDVIIATVGSHPNLKDSAAGRSSIVNSLVEGFYLNQNAVCVRTKNEDVLVQGYIGYLSKYYIFTHYIQMRGKGAANQMRIAIGAIKDYELALPSIEDQRTIAHALSSFDELIENNQKQIKLLEEAAQRLYKEWFIDLRFPGCEEAVIIDGVPEGWKKIPLGNVLQVVRGRSYSSKELSDKEGVLMVNLSNIRPYGGYNREQEKHYTGKVNNNQFVDTHDLLMGVTDMTQERRTVGRVAIVPDLHAKAMISMDLIKLVPVDGSPLFYYALLSYGGYSEVISRFANGTNVLHLRPVVLDIVDAVIPDVRLQNRFVEFFEIIQNRLDVLQDEMIFAVEARDRLLPKLMSGEIEL